MKSKKDWCSAAIMVFGIIMIIFSCIAQKETLLTNKYLIFKRCNIKGVTFYIPNFPDDFIQNQLVLKSDFFELEGLRKSEKYIPADAVILDIGANIGNHSLYWAAFLKPKKIYAFEPIPEIFSTLQKNIELNLFENTIRAVNIGLSDIDSNAEISHYNPGNICETSIKKAKNGNLKVKKLDNIDIKEGRIDLVKIDVEGHEKLVLDGAKETIQKYKPIIFIEFLPEAYNEGNALLEEMGYKLLEYV